MWSKGVAAALAIAFVCAAARADVDPPTDLTCTESGRSVTLAWTNGATYDSISLRRNSVAYQTLTPETTTSTDADLNPGGYTYEVIGVVGAEESPPASCTASIAVPPVADLTCTPGELDVLLAWTNGMATYTSIMIYRDGSAVPIASLSGTEVTHRDAAVPRGVHRYEVVAAFDPLTAPPASCADIVVVLPPVASLTCTVGADRRVHLAWTNGSVPYEGIDVYVDGALAPDSPLAAAAVDCDTLPLAPGDHTLGVQPFVGADRANLVTCAATVPLPAPALTCTPSTSAWEAVIAWSNDWGYERIKIVRGGMAVVEVPAADGSYVDPLPGNGSFLYEVSAVKDGLESEKAACTVDMDIVVAPRVTSCTVAGDRVTIVWTNPMTYERISIARDGIAVGLIGGHDTQFSDVMDAAGTYTYEVCGLAKGMSVCDPSRCTVEVLAPPPVTAIACTAFGRGVLVSWTDGAADYGSIEVRRDGIVVATLLGGVSTFEDPEIEPGTYTYAVTPYYGSIAAPTSTACAAVRPIWQPENLTCVPQGLRVTVEWTNPMAYVQIEIRRDGVLVGTLAGDATSFANTLPDFGTYAYEVTAYVGAVAAAPAACSVNSFLSVFIRGDVNSDGIINIADPVFMLSYLFRDGRQPLCFEASNANNDAGFDVADAVFLLGYAFRGESAPTAPFPLCGPDPDAAHSLGCSSFPPCGP